jgi:chromosome partitioning protein
MGFVFSFLSGSGTLPRGAPGLNLSSSEMIMITIAVVNQKGGVAKSTTAVNLAVGLAASGYRVLGVDLDPQAHLTLGVGVSTTTVGAEHTVAALFYPRPDTRSVIVPTGEPGLRLIPASIRLAKAQESLYNVAFKETKLKKALDQVRAEFDYVVMDCPPNLGVLSTAAIVAADRILVPTMLSRYSLDGLDDLLSTVSELREDQETYDFRVLLTRVKGRAKRQETAWSLLKPIEDRILDTRIRESEAVEQSQMGDEDEVLSVVKESVTRNRAAEDYQALVKEVTTLWPTAPQPHSSETTSKSTPAGNG